MSAASLDHLRQLWAKVDAMFDRVHQAHADQMDCASGCHDCCQRGLTVTAVEAEAILDLVASMSPEERARLAEPAREDRCVALGADGRCGIYAARPLVCRSHGAPIRTSRSLPVLDVCPRNFRQPDLLGHVAASNVFDQETLSTVLAAIEAAFCDAAGLPRGQRHDLADLLTG